MYAFSWDVNSCPLWIECHFSRQPRQQGALSCWARKIPQRLTIGQTSARKAWP
jgi:hypothetical protein